MLRLNADETFNFELLRVLGMARSYGSDVAEVLEVAGKVIPGDFGSWYLEFSSLADHICDTLPGSAHFVSLRNALFRAANYYRTADLFLHGDPADGRINELWLKQRSCFDKAIARLKIPGERIEIETEGFHIPAIVYRPSIGNKPLPVLLLCNGYDGSQEDMLHLFGFGALERGWNVITFEGPGQPTVVREQKLGFIAEWEKVVTPIVNYCQNLDYVDNDKIVLLGYSFGGFLAPRAAAYEHRLAGVVCVDGIFDVYKAFLRGFPSSSLHAYTEKNKNLFDDILHKVMCDNVKLRWGIEQGCWAFCTDSPYEFLGKTRSMTMEGISSDIICPVLVCEARKDRFFEGQPEQLAMALGSRAAYFKFGSEDSAEEHCHIGATDFLTSKIMDWLEENCG